MNSKIDPSDSSNSHLKYYDSDKSFSEGVKIVCLLITSENSALVELRLRLPLERWAFKHRGYIKFVNIFEYKQADIEWGDVFVFHREGGGKHGFQLIQFLKENNKKVVFEIDDLLTDLPKFLLNYKNSVKNKKYLIQSLSLADAITVTTERLGKELSVYNSNIYCVPNCSEALNTIANHYAVPTKDITLIVASSDSILIDFIVQALDKAQKQFSIQIIAIGPIVEHLKKAGLTIKPIEKMTYNRFKHFIASLDNTIGLIPLDNSLFSSCKSPIKYFDYSVAGIPTICSNVPPYSDHIHNRKNGLLVDNNSEAWFLAIESLVTNHFMRHDMKVSALDYVQTYYNWDIAAKEWQILLNNLVPDIAYERANPKPINFPPIIRKRVLHHTIGLITNPLAYKKAFYIIKQEGVVELIKRIKQLFAKLKLIK